MTGPEHYRKAEEMIKDRSVCEGEGAEMTAVFTLAQVHATLALAAATALGCGMNPTDWPAWCEAAR